VCEHWRRVSLCPGLGGRVTGIPANVGHREKSTPGCESECTIGPGFLPFDLSDQRLAITAVSGNDSPGVLHGRLCECHPGMCDFRD